MQIYALHTSIANRPDRIASIHRAFATLLPHMSARRLLRQIPIHATINISPIASRPDRIDLQQRQGEPAPWIADRPYRSIACFKVVKIPILKKKSPHARTNAIDIIDCTPTTATDSKHCSRRFWVKWGKKSALRHRFGATTDIISQSATTFIPITI